MARGSLPFRGDTSAVILAAILNRAPVAPVRLKPGLPPRLEAMINKALERDRDLLPDRETGDDEPAIS